MDVSKFIIFLIFILYLDLKFLLINPSHFMKFKFLLNLILHFLFVYVNHAYYVL